MWQHEVVCLRHLAGDLRIAAFVRIQQRIAVDIVGESGDDKGAAHYIRSSFSVQFHPGLAVRRAVSVG